MTTPILPMSDAEQARFWSKVDRRGPDDCWPWLAGKTYNGYGQFARSTSRKLVRSNRVVLAIKIGRDLGPLLACHSCDNPSCCNPAHLWAGTYGDNTEDADTKGRRRKVFAHCPRCGFSEPITR